MLLLDVGGSAPACCGAPSPVDSGCCRRQLSVGQVGCDEGLCDWRADAVADHARLGGLRDGIAVTGRFEGVRVRKSLRASELTRGEHSHADVEDAVGHARDRDECESVLGGDGIEWLIDQGGWTTSSPEVRTSIPNVPPRALTIPNLDSVVRRIFPPNRKHSRPTAH